VSGVNRASTLEIFCFGLAAIMIIGWSFALIIDWKLNVDDVPQTIAIVAVLLAIGLYKRKKRLGAAF
jgi:hypothetical protein